MPSTRPQLPLTTALVGAGAAARSHATAMGEVTAELRLSAVVDSDAEARAFAEAQWSIPTFASVREMNAALQAARPQAALVATPPSAHEDLTLQLLSQGQHVLCEKPLAATSAAAARMLGAAARADLVLMMASKYRYATDLVEAQRLVRDGLIGEVVWLDVCFCRPTEMAGKWQADPKVAGGGVLIDHGTHAVDIVRGFLGPIARVFAHLGRRVQSVGVEDSVTVHFESGAGALALARLSWSLDPATDWFVSVHGARGTLQVGWTGSRYRLRGQETWTDFGSGYDMTVAMARQLQDFAWLVARPEHQPLVRAEDAIDSVRVIEAAYRAARVERWIPVQGYAGEFA